MPQGEGHDDSNSLLASCLGAERIRFDRLCLGAMSLCLMLSACSAAPSSSLSPSLDAEAVNESTAMESSAGAPLQNPVTYRTHELLQATVHVVRVNTQLAELSLGMAAELDTVDVIARRENAIAAINAGFFDPQNGKTTSYLSAQGRLMGDPTDNERLMNNPDLQPYLPQILNRSELRTYFCKPGADNLLTDADTEGITQYAITFHDAPLPSGCRVDNVWGAGPQLLPRETAREEAFTDYENGVLIRDAIGSQQPNARSAVGIVDATQEIVLLMVAQREDAAGLTLAEMAEFAKDLGVDQLLNLDGGSSSTLYYDGQTYTARLDSQGNPVERPVKSVILVK